MGKLKEKKVELEFIPDNFNIIVRKYKLKIMKIVWKAASSVTHYINRDYITIDELYNYALFGLKESLDRYNKTMGVTFFTYASTRIYGAMMDYIREFSNSNYISRQYILIPDEKLSKIQKRRKQAQLNVNQPLYLYDKKSPNPDIKITLLNTFLDYRYNPELEVIKKEDTKVLHKAIDTIQNTTYKCVCELYFFDNISLKEIADCMLLTEGRISQILKKVKKYIKNYLEVYYE